jgi:coenzyme F420-reducing hydrogenase alpha subunit
VVRARKLRSRFLFSWQNKEATKRFNSLVKQNHAMTLELKDAMDKVIEMVEALELKEAAPEGEPVNNTLNQ